MDILHILPDVLDTGLKVVGTAAAIAAVIPGESKAGNKIGVLYKIMDILACNWGRAKNKG